MNRGKALSPLSLLHFIVKKADSTNCQLAMHRGTETFFTVQGSET